VIDYSGVWKDLEASMGEFSSPVLFRKAVNGTSLLVSPIRTGRLFSRDATSQTAQQIRLWKDNH